MTEAYQWMTDGLLVMRSVYDLLLDLLRVQHCIE